jgi:hypothetical protein
VTPEPLEGHNRRTATRIVTAVLVFHSLALGAGYWVLDRAVHPARAAVAADLRASAPRNAAVPFAPEATPSSRPDLPAWLLQAQHADTAAPWRVDGQGHVHFNRTERAR